VERGAMLPHGFASPLDGLCAWSVDNLLRRTLRFDHKPHPTPPWLWRNTIWCFCLVQKDFARLCRKLSTFF
ncbi:hypothetical protein, partial [Vibrio sp. A1-1]|uniref:hypothetical protein n=1 Tax=Vibrio sp. A1-1 TaxID=2912250 RepID=UPI001F3BAA36